MDIVYDLYIYIYNIFKNIFMYIYIYEVYTFLPHLTLEKTVSAARLLETMKPWRPLIHWVEKTIDSSFGKLTQSLKIAANPYLPTPICQGRTVNLLEALPHRFFNRYFLQKNRIQIVLKTKEQTNKPNLLVPY